MKMEAYGAGSIREIVDWVNAHWSSGRRIVALVRDGGGWVLVYWSE